MILIEEPMESSDKITLNDIDELISFLPELDALNDYIINWEGAESGTFPYPVYPDTVAEFFRAAGKKCWTDYDYLKKVNVDLMKEKDVILNSSLEEMKSVITWCVRGERFSAGHWNTVLKNGIVFAVLERLKILKEELAR